MSKFMITDGKENYLRRDVKGNFCLCKGKAFGDVWEQKCKAQNVLTNCVNKNLRSRYKIVEIADEIEKKSLCKNKTQKYKAEVKPKEDLTKKLGDEVYDDDKLNSLASDIDNLSDFVQSAEERKEKLLKTLSDVDKEISDIDHYIEFGKGFNAYQGWLAFTMLRSRLIKRRKIKDELHILVQLGECKVNSAMIEDIKNPSKN